MLEFKFHYTKIANLFHFISNLTEWHFSCRKNYNKMWLEKTGPLKNGEKQALRKMRKLLGRYGFSRERREDPSRFLGIPFIVHSDWGKVEEWVEPDEFLTLKDVFEVFEPRFEKIWMEEEPKLANWKTALVEELTKRKYDNLEKDLETFFNQKPKFSNIDVYLLMGVAKSSGGGANIGPGRVTLEPTGLSTDLAPEMLNVLYREATHLVFEREYYQNLLKQFLKSTKDKFSEKHAFSNSERGPRTIIKEAVTTSLLPEGYLANKYFGADIFKRVERVLGKNFEKVAKGEKDDFGAWRLFAAAKLFPLVKDYIENKKPVDRVYLQKVWEVFEEFSEKVG